MWTTSPEREIITEIFMNSVLLLVRPTFLSFLFVLQKKSAYCRYDKSSMSFSLYFCICISIFAVYYKDNYLFPVASVNNQNQFIKLIVQEKMSVSRQ